MGECPPLSPMLKLSTVGCLSTHNNTLQVYREQYGRPLNDMNMCLGRVHTASYNTNRIGGVMVKSAVDRGFEPRSGHIKDYKNRMFFSDFFLLIMW
jgi:hypothetical protein